MLLLVIIEKCLNENKNELVADNYSLSLLFII